GLFMSVMYPTINSKGISCMPKAEHGVAAGVILFFTCVSAVVAPLAMGAVSDAMGAISYGFWLATGCAGLLFLGLLLNWLIDPTRAVLEQLELTESQEDGRETVWLLNGFVRSRSPGRSQLSSSNRMTSSRPSPGLA